MSTIFTNVFNINGVVDTSKSVMSNLQNIANACNTWVTFDNATGRWSVVINRDGSSVVSINESHMVGPLTVSGTGINEFYNGVQFTYPHKDLLDQNDTVTLTIPSANRFPNEFENVLNFSADLINDPIQAEYVASVELKQSRIDKVIRFNTDFSMLGVKAGDLVSITNSVYGFDSKLFRILTVSEEDGDDNVLSLSFTAYEHDANIYSLGDLEREERSAVNNVISQCSNTATQASNGVATGNSLLAGLLGPAGALLLTQLLNSLLGPKSAKRLANGGSFGNANQVLYASTDVLSVTPSGTLAPLVTSPTLTFTAEDGGKYAIDSYWNFGGDPAPGVSVKAALIEVYTGLTYGSGTKVEAIQIQAGTSDDLSDKYDDLDVHSIYDLSAGDYHLRFQYRAGTAVTFLYITTTVSGPINNYIQSTA